MNKRKQLIKIGLLTALPVLIAFSQNGLNLFSSDRSRRSLLSTMSNMLASSITGDLSSAFVIAFSQIIWISAFILSFGDEIASDVRECSSFIFSRFSKRSTWLKKQFKIYLRESTTYYFFYTITCLFIALRVPSTKMSIGQIMVLILFLFTLYLMLFFFGLLCNVLAIQYGTAISCTITFLILFVCSGLSSLTSLPMLLYWLNPLWIPIQISSEENSWLFLFFKLILLVVYCFLLTLFINKYIQVLDLGDSKERGKKT